MSSPRFRVTPQRAVAAVREAARAEHVEPAALTPSRYRVFRGEHAHDPERPPSELAISLLFGGWQQACAAAQAPGPSSRWRRM